MITLAIDPGAHGALAFFDNGTLVDVDAMPGMDVLVAGKRRRRVSAGGLASLIFKHGHVEHVFVERTQPTPVMNTRSSFGLGLASGVVEGVVAAVGLPITFIAPQAWKKGLGLDADKDRARMRATQLFPEHAARFARKSDDGFAEAALIGFYGLQKAGSAP